MQAYGEAFHYRTLRDQYIRMARVKNHEPKRLAVWNESHRFRLNQELRQSIETARFYHREYMRLLRTAKELYL
jgi:oligoribonuclease (3'-5' exoribonuclease)